MPWTPRNVYWFIYLIICFLLKRNNVQVVYEPVQVVYEPIYKNSSSKKWSAS